MQFNNLEQEFFNDVLQAELDAPVKAILLVDNEEFPLIVIPQVSESGYFELRYHGAPAYRPEPVKGRLSFTASELEGIHPRLNRLWIDGSTVKLRFEERPAPTFFEGDLSGPEMEVKVILADAHHRGILSLKNNQIVVRESTLREARFSLVDFPKIRHPAGQSWLGKLLNEGEYENFQAQLREVSKLLPENKASVQVIPQESTVLKTGTGWTSTLTKDDENTRGDISYSGLITRDGEEFSVHELSHLLEGLTYFLSFTACAFRHPTAVIGYDSEDLATWGQIGRFNLRPPSTNWFSYSNMVSAGAILELLFPRFWSAWEKRQKEVSRIIEFYVNSQSMQQAGFLKEAVATSYAGLDMLAHLLVSSPAKGYSAEVVQKALAKHRVPNPSLDSSKTPVTTKLAMELGLSPPGIPLINKVRDYVVHPLERKGHEIKSQYAELLDNTYSEYFHVHDLSQYFLEYLLLHGLCNCPPVHYRLLAETIHR